MRFDPKGRPRRVIGPLAIVLTAAIAFRVSALESSRDEKRLVCRAEDFSKKEKRFVSLFTTEDLRTRWYLPAIVTVCISQDETQAYRRIDTVYWQDGAHIDFEDCMLYGNFVGDCRDDQGRRWRAKVFAKITDEMPKELHYPENSIPSIRALLRE